MKGITIDGPAVQRRYSFSMETKRILLIEDTAAIAKLTKFRLEKAGFEVITAAGGESALEIIKDDIPDIILLDYTLPDMPGSDVIKTVKSDHRFNSIPIIIFTASLENVKLARELGAVDGIIKPYEPDELILKIKRHLAIEQ